MASSSSAPSTSAASSAPLSTGSKPTKSKGAKRNSRACEVCKRRKVKCDGASGGPADPAVGGVAEVPCGPCARHGVACFFEPRVEPAAATKAYIVSLEARLASSDALERRVQELEALLAHKQSVQAVPIHVSMASTSAEGAARRSPGEPAVSESAYQLPVPPTALDEIHRLGEKLDDLTLEKDRYVGRGSGMHLIEATSQQLSVGQIPARDSLSLVEKLMRTDEPSPPLPSLPQTVLKRIVDAAFEHTARWPLLVREHFDDGLNNGLFQTDRSFRSLYFAILALGSRFIDDACLDPVLPPTLPCSPSPKELRMARGYAFFAASRAAATPELVSATLFDILASTFQLFYLTSTTSHVTCWSSIGLAIRRAVDVGVHREARSRWTTSPMHDQLRKRAFYILVAFERSVSSMLGRPLTLRDADIDVELPLDIADDLLLEWDRHALLARANGFGQPSVPAGVSTAKRARCSADLCSIMALAADLYAPRPGKGTPDALKELDERLNSWLEENPPDEGWDPPSMSDSQLSASAWIRISYYQCQMLIHREFMSPARSALIGYNSLAICSNAARSCARVLDELRRRNLLKGAFDWAPDVAVASGLVLILAVFAVPSSSSRPSLPASLTPSALADVRRCLDVLDTLTECSFLALRCSDSLRRLAGSVAPRMDDVIVDSCAGSSEPSVEHQESSSGTLKRSHPEEDRSNDASLRAQRKSRRLSTLPMSTVDLSSSTFGGAPTFSFDCLLDHTSLPSLPIPPQQLQQNSLNSSAPLPPAPTERAFGAVALPAPLGASSTAPLPPPLPFNPSSYVTFSPTRVLPSQTFPFSTLCTTLPPQQPQLDQTGLFPPFSFFSGTDSTGFPPSAWTNFSPEVGKTFFELLSDLGMYEQAVGDRGRADGQGGIGAGGNGRPA
ncbi:hypothetical protein JCM8547_003505 [Rhodosporidiobolus lusitaniae]